MAKKYFVKKYGNQSFTAKELVNLEHDLNSYDAVKADTDLTWKTYKDFDFRTLAAEELGYTIGDDGVIHGSTGGSGRSGNRGTGGTGGGNEDHSGCIWGIVLSIIFIVIIAFFVGNNTPNRPTMTGGGEEPVDTMVVDTTAVDSTGYYNYDSDEWAVDTAVAYDETVNDYLNVSATSVSFDSDGGYYTFNVNSNTYWNINTGTDEWGHLSRNGDLLTLTIKPNSSTSSRSDYFIISAGSKSVRINIYQHGENVSFWEGDLYINRSIYTDIQIWTLHKITFSQNATICHWTIENRDKNGITWAYNTSGGYIYDNNRGNKYYKKTSSLPSFDHKAIISYTEQRAFTNSYPPIPSTVHNISIVDPSGVCSINNINIK